ncbi:MAG TPA: hypothetical protein VLA34_07035, partial [Candidatus Krumholzibacterium sp.]|nr:hypothetical protein [Candidatus Krumholzibacterium sp.]
DEGRTEGYFGIAILGHSHPYPYGNSRFYKAFSLNGFKVFRGLQPYAAGGDPTNDFERYQILSDGGFDGNTETPGDYRFLISVGPFYEVPFKSSIHFDLAFVAGNSLLELKDNAAAAQFIYNGIYFDLDGDPRTGVDGREAPMVGPLEEWDPDGCDGVEQNLEIIKGDTIWSNLDCYKELYAFNHPLCYRDFYATLKDYQTGVDGRESQLFWIIGGAPPPPNIRVVPGDRNVTVLWDNLSETVPDLLTGIQDFEGYQIWRADDWHRPLGSNKDNGPESHLWSLLESRDLVNGVIPDIDFLKPFESGGWQYTPLLQIEDRETLLTSFEQSLIYAPLDTVPCPPGLTQEECDTLEAVARDRLGFEGGKKYYKFVDDSAKNGIPYFYSVVAYDHNLGNNVPVSQGRFTSPSSNFAYVEAKSAAQEAEEFDTDEVYAVPNPVTLENMSPWQLGPTNDDASGLKVELRNLPACKNVVRIYTISGDLVMVIHHDGSGGNGTVSWNLVSRNGQDVTSGVYIFAVEPEDGRFDRAIGKFVIIR